MKAVCVLTNNIDKKIKGYIEFTENNNLIVVKVKIIGLKTGYHGIHIHEYGDLREGCSSLCSHFNPYNTNHGSPANTKNNRHIGDLGNLFANKMGIVDYTFTDKLIKLKGKANIIGRSVVIHENFDDLGLGGIDLNTGIIIDNEIREESLKTGNAGKRIACGVIGWAK